ncbi:hypothetical protein D3C75_1181990 [compost metagenome]
MAAQQAYQFGYKGMQLLTGRIADKESEGAEEAWTRILLPAELVVRRSVADLH